jgi:hypothetical protein
MSYFDYRALCAELLDALLSEPGPAMGQWSDLIARARAALAQPEAVGPTDDELDELWAEIDGGGAIWAWQPYARAVLARWGSPNPTTATAATP